ncbi:HalOD1 output domain-containing protein [Natrinema soli]|uniref:HalOD1 output domain-containing protein n=1 Tax=Natrinema soli TaxID=1930624 RepID=A0ABD5SLL3_9EURY|nr:HalOD1 output domain-containing protein [Natrinema soli]
MRFDSATIRPTIAIIKMMSAVCDKEPTQLTPLYDVVDTETLNQLFAKSKRCQEEDYIVEFSYYSHQITVESAGIIEAQPLSAEGGDDDDPC